MKYYYQLSQLEQEVIRLKSFYSTFRVISNGIEQSSHEDINEALFYLEGSLEDIQTKLDDAFQTLWSDVREEWVEEDLEELEDEQSNDVWNHVVENLQINPNISEENA
jgi:5-methylthioribose kinase